MFLPFDRFLIHKLSLFSQVHLGFVLWWSADLSLNRLSVILLVVGHIMLAVILIVFWIIPSINSISWLQSYVFRQTVQLTYLFDELLRFLWRIQLLITSALLGKKEIWDELGFPHILIIIIEINFCCYSRFFLLEFGDLFICGSTAHICCDLRRNSIHVHVTCRLVHVSGIGCTHIFQFSVVGCPFTNCILFARLGNIWAKDLARAKSPGWRSLNRGRVGALLRFHNARNYPFKLLFRNYIFKKVWDISNI